MKMLLYCTKAKPLLRKNYKNQYYCDNHSMNYYINRNIDAWSSLNGKIVGECDFEVEDIESKVCYDEYDGDAWYETNLLNSEELYKKSCLTFSELFNYLNGKNGYAIHIKNLVIYDTPRELREFKANYHIYDKFYDEPWAWHWVDRAPQNMMYVEDNGEKKILISIRPEWMRLILNGEKTIEVRKKVLKEMV